MKGCCNKTTPTQQQQWCALPLLAGSLILAPQLNLGTDLNQRAGSLARNAQNPRERKSARNLNFSKCEAKTFQICKNTTVPGTNGMDNAIISAFEFDRHKATIL